MAKLSGHPLKLSSLSSFFLLENMPHLKSPAMYHHSFVPHLQEEIGEKMRSLLIKMAIGINFFTDKTQVSSSFLIFGDSLHKIEVGGLLIHFKTFYKLLNLFFLSLQV
jgi:hypothetical protein